MNTNYVSINTLFFGSVSINTKLIHFFFWPILILKINTKKSGINTWVFMDAKLIQNWYKICINGYSCIKKGVVKYTCTKFRNWNLIVLSFENKSIIEKHLFYLILDIYIDNYDFCYFLKHKKERTFIYLFSYFDLFLK